MNSTIKACNGCGQRKNLDEFYSDARYPDGHRAVCKECLRAWHRRNRRLNKVAVNKAISEWGKRNRTRIRARNRPRMKKRYATDANYRAKKILLGCLYETLIGRCSSPTILSLTGFASRASLMEHFEKQFEPGMSWDNYGKVGWEVDHVRPLCFFDLTDPAQRQTAFAPANMRPRWQSENNSGLNQYSKEELRRT